MRFTVYKTTNLVNGKIYIGAHKTEDPNDGYLGSGSAMETAIRRYGRGNFRKEVLFDFDTEAEMLQKEAELVTASFCSRDDNYNLKEGGRYGVHSPESRRKISEAGRRAQNQPEVLEANRQRGRELLLDPLKKKALQEGNARRLTTPEGKETARDNLRKTAPQRAAGNRKAWAAYTEEERQGRVERVAEACRTPEYRERMREINRQRSSDPAYRRKLAMRRRRGESHQAWQARLMRGFEEPPEVGPR